MILIGGLQKNQAVKTDGICTTLTSSMGCGGGYVPLIVNKNTRGTNIMNNSNMEYKIRKLTPKECWRLMGLNDNDFDSAKAVGLSDTSLYKQAGNGIIINCCELLAEHLYKAQYDNTYVCTDEKFVSEEN